MLKQTTKEEKILFENGALDFCLDLSALTTSWLNEVFIVAVDFFNLSFGDTECLNQLFISLLEKVSITLTSGVLEKSIRTCV